MTDKSRRAEVPPTQEYRLISADTHVNEPGDLWTTRVPARFKDRVPRIQRFPEGDGWVIEGASDPINFGMNACAGLDPEEQKGWVRFEDIRHGGYEPAARLEEMNKDGVDAEILYPTPRLSQGVAANRDADLHQAMISAYNDWLSEYTGGAPSRFGGLAMLPNCGAEHAVAEINRVWGRPGIRGFLMTAYPNGSLEIASEDDKVWAAVTERGASLNVHVSLTMTMPAAHRVPLPGYGRFFDAPNRIVQMIFAGIFDRFPTLQVVFAEVDSGWVPYFKEQIDGNFLRLRPTSNFTIRDLPSRYVDRHISTTFINDTFGVRVRHDIGVDRMLWSSDYPHISANWPNSQRLLQATFSGVPPAEAEMILVGNAARLYGFGRE
jgi:predicted TIM-barrel fold metal-dependent hydrolase